MTPTALGLADASATTAAAALASGSGSTTTAAPSPEYGEVVWTTAVDPTTKEPTEPVDAFVVDAPTLYAVIPVRNVPRDTTLTAEWMYNATSLDSLTTNVAAASGIADGWIAFHLTRSAEPWPDGTYAISISVLGRVVQTAEIAVEHR